MLEKASTVTKSNHQPILTMSTNMVLSATSKHFLKTSMKVLYSVPAAIPTFPFLKIKVKSPR